MRSKVWSTASVSRAIITTHKSFLSSETASDLACFLTARIPVAENVATDAAVNGTEGFHVFEAVIIQLRWGSLPRPTLVHRGQYWRSAICSGDVAGGGYS